MRMEAVGKRREGKKRLRLWAVSMVEVCKRKALVKAEVVGRSDKGTSKRMKPFEPALRKQASQCGGQLSELKDSGCGIHHSRACHPEIAGEWDRLLGVGGRFPSFDSRCQWFRSALELCTGILHYLSKFQEVFVKAQRCLHRVVCTKPSFL